jgi:ribosome-binding factor A
MPGRHRTERLNELFKRELSRLLLTGIRDPRVSGVTVNDVRVTNDLSYATVFITVDSATDPEGAMEGLEHAAGFIRRELGQGMQLRKIPEFRFETDTTMARANRIDDLLRQAREADAALERTGRQAEFDGEGDAGGEG